MKLKKPIEEFTLEELEESREHLQGLINATQVIKDNLGDSSDPFTNLLDFHLRMTVLPDASMKSFMELTEHNMNNFKLTYGIIIEEIRRREVQAAADKVMKKYAGAIEALK